MNYNRVGFVGTTLLFFLMISPAGAESVADKLKQTLDKLKQLQGQQQPNQASSPAGQAAAPNQNNAPKVSSSQSSTAKTPAAHGPARNVDVVGLRIGMSVDEATKALKARHPGGNLTRSEDIFEGLPPTHVLYALESKNWKSGQQLPVIETITVAFAGPPGSPSVVGIGREEVYVSEGKQPSRQVLLQALNEKYGPHDYNSLNAYRWLLDTVAWSGSVPRAHTCSGHVGKLGMGGIPSKDYILNPESIGGRNSSCGRVLEVYIVPTNQNRNLVRSLQVSIYDHRLVFEGMNKAQEQVSASAARLRAEETKKATSNRPTL